ncbi:MAG: hypothetical protein EA376_01290, partial [Phycisphaeraceae bacterium]
MIHAAAPAADPRNIRAVATIQAVGNAKAGEPVRFRGVAYTGGMLRVAGFESGVVIDLAGLQIPGSLPIATDHRSDLDARLGSATARVEDGALVIEGTIVPGTPSADRAIALMRAGGLSLSIGARPVKLERLRDGATINGQSFAGRPEVATESELVEVSAVGVGADRGATAIAAGATPTGGGADPVIAERERIANIDASFSGLAGDEAQGIRATAIKDGWTLERAQGEALQLLRASRPNVNGVRGASTGGVSPAEKLTAAALTLAGQDAEKLIGAGAASEGAGLGCNSALDLCAAALRMEGHTIPTSRSQMIEAAVSTTSLPIALAAGVEKVALDSFMNAAEPWRMFARKISLRNFKPTELVRLAASARFLELGGDGELKHAPIGEETGNIRLRTFGRIVGLDRRTIIDDDLQILNDIAGELGREGARTIGDIVNETLEAGVGTFWHTDNGNVMTGSGSALSVDAIAFAIALVRKQTDSSGRRIGLMPRFLAVGPDNEAFGRAVLNSLEVEVAEGEPRGNPVRGALELLVDPRIEGLQWYVFTDPRDACLAVGLLDGRESITLEQREPPAEKLGMQWRAFIDAAAALR